VVKGNGEQIPVMTLDEFVALDKDTDLFISIIKPELKPKEIAEQIASFFKDTKLLIYIYWYNAGDPAEYPLVGKIFATNPFNSDRAARNLIKENPSAFKPAFIEADILDDNEFMSEVIEAKARNSIVFRQRIEYENHNGRYIRYDDGKRNTTNQPEIFERRCLVFGDSIVWGNYSSDKYTVCSQLQRKLNENDLLRKYKVENFAVSALSLNLMLLNLKKILLNAGDIVCLCKPVIWIYSDVSINIIIEANKYCLKNKCRFILVGLPRMGDLAKLTVLEKKIFDEYLRKSKIYNEISLTSTSGLFEPFDNRLHYRLINACTQNGILFYSISSDFYNTKKTRFLDHNHLGDYGNQILATQLFEIISALEDEVDFNSEDVIAKRKVYERESMAKIMRRTNKGLLEYEEYLRKEYSIDPSAESAAIVMNCNPFTKGHRYLIEQAAKRERHVYIFVVQEDKSNFKFEDRFRLVRENIKDLQNVTVLPSGEFIISYLTFPDYFTKEGAVPNEKPSTEMDLLIFAACIAPSLNIKTRYVGEEPYDPVTKAYNEQMKETLPYYGVDVIEIPRIVSDTSLKAISASEVRRLLKAGDTLALRELVPQATYDFLARTYDLQI
jgi:phosphopantetheine adenylyltransferase